MEMLTCTVMTPSPSASSHDHRVSRSELLEKERQKSCTCGARACVRKCRIDLYLMPIDILASRAFSSLFFRTAMRSCTV